MSSIPHSTLSEARLTPEPPAVAVWGDALDALDLATLLVDGAGVEQARNATFDAVLQRDADGRLEAWVRAWAAARAPLAAQRAPGSRLGDAEWVSTEGGVYRVTGVALDGAVAVVVEPVGLRLPEPEAIRRRFGLTRREAEVACLLAQGHTDREIADDLIVAHATARRHTERVLAKLGVSRRAAVASRLAV